MDYNTRLSILDDLWIIVDYQWIIMHYLWKISEYRGMPKEHNGKSKKPHRLAMGDLGNVMEYR